MTDQLEQRLTKLHGIGAAKARDLVAAGVKSPADLRKPKYFNMLDVDAQIHLKYRVTKEVPRGMATRLINRLPHYLIPVGSYRRRSKAISDLDLLTTLPICRLIEDLERLADNFKFIFVYMCGAERASMIISFAGKNIHVDVFHTAKEDLPYALFHWTGNKNFNIRARAHAKRQGYKLNQYGLFRGDKKIKVNDERELFDILGVTYKEPWQRSE